jgi:uncharacterized membrane protein
MGLSTMQCPRQALAEAIDERNVVTTALAPPAPCTRNVTRAVSSRGNQYLVALAWSAIVIGCALRFVQLPTRVLFDDETVTQMRVAGYTADRLWQTIYDGRQRTVRNLREFTTVDTRSTPAKVLASLATEDAQHGPVFYLAELAMTRSFGNGLLVWRLLPALFGTLAVAAAYALARTVFLDPASGLFAAALFAISPIERIYSEQAREYSLLSLCCLVATLLLVRARRSNTVGAWSLYAAIITAALFVSPLTGLVIAAHAAYIFAVGRSEPHARLLRAYCVTVLAAVILYSPWLAELITHRSDIASTNAWSAQHWPFALLAAKWIFNIGSTLFDLEYIDLRWATAFAIVAAGGVVAAVLAFRSVDREARWLLGCTIVVPALILIVPDVVLGEHRSAVARYSLATFGMLTILIGRGLVGRPVVASIVMFGALASCIVGSAHTAWWDNDSDADDASIARIIDRQSNAQLVSSAPPETILTFANVLDHSVRVSLTASDGANIQFDRHDPLFVIDSDAATRNSLRRAEPIVLKPVSYKPATTAHDVGAKLGASSDPVNESRLYSASSVVRFR